ncbi:putative translation initiation factor eIF-2B subunit epsilon [Pseudocercospora fuligena]|uniref:Mannose-1-phosphate guanyltransferase n=1 Tax=Pseudocercospora fuligena TaxID=685502 RepID=A0A8H6RTV1_9PEZI|nr:putative translation initiation factor eIF-2B subunit epsilon [Pseudocercospora fuligena]
MPPKGKKGGGKDKGEEKREEPLQAVIFADSFETRFNPFTLERPRCLLPLAGTPLIEYTLEFLANAGVEEVILYCGNHTEAVEEYLNHSKWILPTSPFELQIIRSNSRSVGDCMRDLDAKGLIEGDFISVYGDVVANIPLEGALAAHRARREKDKYSIQTMVLREATGSHRAQSKHLRRVFVLDSETHRCVHYEQLRPGESAMLDIPGEVLKDHVELEVREDLVDCGIDICTPEVLAQYTDNFDWQLPRRGFLYGVLKDFETFQHTIHTHIATEGYAARVKNLQTFDAISKDVVSRWTYPLTPDINLVAGQSFQLYKGNVYKEDGVVLARSSIVNRRTVLGKATSVGEHTTITNSIIGRRCIIGKRVKIDGAYIWDDAHIGDDAVIGTAIIANEASIGRKCKVEDGALISYGVRVADGTTVSGDKRITTLKRKRGYETDEVMKAPADPKIVGADGHGYHMQIDEDEEELVDSLLSGVENLNFTIDEDAISELESEDDEDNDFSGHHVRRESRSDSFASADSEESKETRAKARDFHNEAVGSLVDDMAKGNDPSNISLELKALILGSNAQDEQIRRATAVAFGKCVSTLIEAGQSPNSAVTDLLPRYSLLITSIVKEEDEQAEFLLFLQRDLVHRAQGSKILLFMSNALAKDDIIEAEGFEAWWNDEKSSENEQLEEVRKETKQLVDVLCADDESSEEEEDSDDE